MALKRICYIATAALFFWTMGTYADGDEFDADKMLSELESQLKLSSEKLSEMIVR